MACETITFDDNKIPHSYNDKCCQILEDGTKIWAKHGWYHRENAPAVIGGDGTLKWYKDGYLHRDGGLPAITYKNGNEEYWFDGKRDRKGGLPAVVNLTDRIEEYWENGYRHRSGDLPAVVNKNRGIQEYWDKGRRHRSGDLPAVNTKTRIEYWEKNKLHRLGNLPAVQDFSSPDYIDQEFWVFGEFISRNRVALEYSPISNICIGAEGLKFPCNYAYKRENIRRIEIPLPLGIFAGISAFVLCKSLSK